MAIIRKSIDVTADDTPSTFGIKLDNLGIDHNHLDLNTEFKLGFRGQTVVVEYDHRDKKWFATKWNDPTE